MRKVSVLLPATSMDMGDGVSMSRSAAMWEDLEYEFNNVTSMSTPQWSAFGFGKFAETGNLACVTENEVKMHRRLINSGAGTLFPGCYADSRRRAFKYRCDVILLQQLDVRMVFGSNTLPALMNMQTRAVTDDDPTTQSG